MTILEEFLSSLNADLFLREFSFGKNTFFPKGGDEVEFADHVIWVDDLLILYQLKQRDAPSNSPKEERKWFENKVLRKATKQIRGTLKYLEEQKEIRITNQRGHTFSLSSKTVSTPIKVVLYLSGENLPEDCSDTKYHLSKTAGFIHVLPIHDYLGVCGTLITAADISEYFGFREYTLKRWCHKRNTVSEKALVGQYIAGDDNACPDEKYANYFESLENDIEEFDLSFLLYDYGDRIAYVEVEGTYEDKERVYYDILAEFAKLDRAELREIMRRIRLCVEACEANEFKRPYRQISMRTGCGFVIVPIQEEYYDHRLQGLKNYTYGAKYDRQGQRQVGISFTKTGNTYMVDWCFMDFPWEYDAKMEKWLQENFPFRPLKSKKVSRFQLRK